MYFAKNEIIELSDERVYLVVDTALLDEKAYYKVELLEADDNRTGIETFITAINDNGKLFVNDQIPKEIKEKLEEIFR